MRQNVKRRSRNRGQRATLRGALKRVRAATSAEDAGAAYASAEKLLDRAAGKNLIHPNQAARHKSRLRKVISGLSQG
jgi:small subunit ribosomal protein S20